FRPDAFAQAPLCQTDRMEWRSILPRRAERHVPAVQKTDDEWRAELTHEQYRVLRGKGTERAFSGEYDHVFEPGTYRRAGCGAELFDAETKFDSGSGWPSFYAPAS